MRLRQAVPGLACFRGTGYGGPGLPPAAQGQGAEGEELFWAGCTVVPSRAIIPCVVRLPQILPAPILRCVSSTKIVTGRRVNSLRRRAPTELPRRASVLPQDLLCKSLCWERHAPAWLLKPSWSPAIPGMSKHSCGDALGTGEDVAEAWPPEGGAGGVLPGLTIMRHLFAQAAISRLMRGATIDVRIVAVPDDFVPPKPSTFDKDTMNALADLGEKMGEDASSWRTEAP